MVTVLRHVAFTQYDTHTQNLPSPFIVLSRYKAEGYYGVEAISLSYLDGNGAPNMTFLNQVKEAGLVLVPQVHTCGGRLNSTGYVYCSSSSVDEHVASLESQLGELNAVAEVVSVPIVNVHSGHDSWGGEAEAKVRVCARVNASSFF